MTKKMSIVRTSVLVDDEDCSVGNLCVLQCCVEDKPPVLSPSLLPALPLSSSSSSLNSPSANVGVSVVAAAAAAPTVSSPLSLPRLCLGRGGYGESDMFLPLGQSLFCSAEM